MIRRVMKSEALLVLFLTVFFLSSCSRIFYSRDPFENFKETIHQANSDRNAAYAGHVFHPYDQTTQIDDELGQLKSALDQAKLYDAEIHLKNLVNQFLSDESVQQSGKNLLDSIRELEKKELVALDANAISLKQKLGDALLTAEKPEDLDSILQDLQDFSRRVGQDWRYNNGNNLDAYHELLHLKPYVTRWQDFLLARMKGNTPEAQRLYRYLTFINVQGLPLPRSKVIERLDFLNRSGPSVNTSSTNSPASAK